MRKFEGYDYSKDSNGNPIAIDRTTGEVQDAVRITVPVGSKVFTPQDQERYNQWRAQQQREHEQKEIRRLYAESLGKHFYVPAHQGFMDLAPQTVTRLVFLETFADYNNRLNINAKRAMQREDIASVLGVSQRTVDDFLCEVISAGYLEQKDDGLFFTNRSVFVRGKLKPGSSYRRLYIDAIRRLYAATPKNKHKHLGYALKLIPYLSVEYNVACHNPEETDMSKIDYLTLDEFCDLIHFKKRNRYKLVGSYENLQFPVGDHTECLCSIVINQCDLGKAKLYLNPNVMYSGSCFEKVEILGSFCRD